MLTKISAGIYLLKVNNGKARPISEISLFITVKTSLTTSFSVIFIVTFEQISHTAFVFPLLTLNK